jgi:hypothetical protein
VIDWGSNAWYLSGPWRQFTTNSIGFNGRGPTSASFRFLSPRRVISIDAFNGGATSSTISVECAGQPSVVRALGGNQLATIQTSWSGTCDTVTIGSSNGWDTNFDRLVIGGSASGTVATSTATATPTSTPTPTPTRTSTPTPTPVATSTAISGRQTVTFNDLPSPNRALGGQYPAGVIDWGTNSWYLSAPWRQFTTNSIGFNGPGLTSATFTLLTPRRVVSIDAYNGGTVSTTVTTSCAGMPTRTFALAAGQLATLDIAWLAECASITLTSSNGWNTNFDNVVLEGVP